MRHVLAKALGWGQLVLHMAEQASNGHFPQNKNEWFSLAYSVFVALAVHHAASTDGQK